MADSNGLKMPSLGRLQSQEQMELLDVVDSLRACHLGDIIALPQLIVCGDQSSGKSSVLEAISGLPFPRQENVCTRFATEVILRRASEDRISVSIDPAKERSRKTRNLLLQFRRNLKTKEDFSEMFESAKQVMGLSSSGKSFSNDVLRVEFSGPSLPQLTLVDLPGLIQSATSSQTADDVELVKALVSGYLVNPRSIILAVVSAGYEPSNQAILDRAREVDPKGLRTLGIITKPDTLVKGSKLEDSFITLAKNEDVKFSLGWHAVKNLDLARREQNGNGSRDEQENLFFRESSFNVLQSSSVGIEPLRNRLSKVLFNQIRSELPRLVEEIQTNVLEAKAVSEKLGPSRAEIDQQRLFLISLSQSFQSICRDAVRGDYDDKFFHDDTNPGRRLCANIMNMHFQFAEKMREQGAAWIIQDNKVDEDEDEDDDEESEESEEDYDSDNDSDDENAERRERRQDKLQRERFELENEGILRTRQEAIEEACTLLKRSRGREVWPANIVN